MWNSPILKSALERLVPPVVAIASIVMACTSVLSLWTIYTRGSDNLRPDRPSGVKSLTDVVIERPLAEAGTRTNHDAKVAFVEFSDFECQYCGRHAREVFPKMREAFLDAETIDYVFFNLPVPTHINARVAAEAVECAANQRQFWGMHDALFQNQGSLSRADLGGHAVRLNLDTSRFDACMDGEVADRVTASIAEAKRLAVRATPTFFLGVWRADGSLELVKQITGLHPFSIIQSSIDELLR